MSGILINDRIITPNDILSQLVRLPDISPDVGRDLLDPADKQNVPKAVMLIRRLNSLNKLPNQGDQFEQHRASRVGFLSSFFSLFLEPFIDVTMSRTV